jgi:hypothetical protein
MIARLYTERLHTAATSCFTTTPFTPRHLPLWGVYATERDEIENSRGRTYPPRAMVWSLIAGRTAWSLVFEVLPVWLLALQSLAAISYKGDVDARSNTPLFSRPVNAIRKVARRGQTNQKLTDFLGRWTINERHNMNEFLEGAP